MSQIESIIIVGASAAGVNCVRQLRSLGFIGKITLIDKDKHGAYERPPLSKKILLDAASSHNDILLIDDTELEKLNVDTRFGEMVVGLNPAEKTLQLKSGEMLKADAIVLATGGEARRLPIPGSDLPNVFVLRHFDDAMKLRDKLKPSAKVAVIGGGFIGAETVASLGLAGIQVYWLDASELPLSHLLPKDLSKTIVNYHQKQGIEVFTSCKIDRFIAEDNEQVSIAFQTPKQGEKKLIVDAIIMGVGMIPNMDYLSQKDSEQMICKIRGGMRVNEKFETSYPGIYAIGDMASVKYDDDTISRCEHWQSAQHQGAVLGSVLLNSIPPVEPVDWFWSDQGDLHIEMAGNLSNAAAQLVVREEGDFPIYFSLIDDRLSGAVSINNPNAVRIAMRMIRDKVSVNADKLTNPEISLREQLRG